MVSRALFKGLGLVSDYEVVLPILRLGGLLVFDQNPLRLRLHCNNKIIKENNPAASILHSDTQGDTLYTYF